MKRKRGRPPKAEKDRQDAALTCKVTTLFGAEFNAHAERVGTSASAIMRRVLESYMQTVGKDKIHNV